MVYLKNKYTYHVNSALRSSGDSNYDFRYQFNVSPQANIDSICLLDAQIPKSYYVVQQEFDTFVLSEDGVEVTITMDDGNYNRKNFASNLVSKLNNASPNGFTYNITYDNSSTADTGKYYYTVNNTSVPILFKFPAQNTIYAQMGFNVFSENQFTSGALTSTNVINLQSENSIFLHCDAIANIEGDDVLAILYGSSNSDYSFISYQVTDVQAYSRRIGNLSNDIGFKLLDENGLPVRLNGINITFTFILYKAVHVEDRLERFFTNYAQAFERLIETVEQTNTLLTPAPQVETTQAEPPQPEITPEQQPEQQPNTIPEQAPPLQVLPTLNVATPTENQEVEQVENPQTTNDYAERVISDWR